MTVDETNNGQITRGQLQKVTFLGTCHILRGYLNNS